jgi:hypothetical protein
MPNNGMPCGAAIFAACKSVPSPPIVTSNTASSTLASEAGKPSATFWSPHSATRYPAERIVSATAVAVARALSRARST